MSPRMIALVASLRVASFRKISQQHTRRLKFSIVKLLLNERSSANYVGQLAFDLAQVKAKITKHRGAYVSYLLGKRSFS